MCGSTRNVTSCYWCSVHLSGWNRAQVAGSPPGPPARPISGLLVHLQARRPGLFLGCWFISRPAGPAYLWVAGSPPRPTGPAYLWVAGSPPGPPARPISGLLVHLQARRPGLFLGCWFISRPAGPAYLWVAGSPPGPAYLWVACQHASWPYLA